MAYLLPEQLREFVGPVGVWGDVNDILRENLDAMKVSTMQAPAKPAAAWQCPLHSGNRRNPAAVPAASAMLIPSIGKILVHWPTGVCGGERCGRAGAAASG